MAKRKASEVAAVAWNMVTDVYGKSKYRYNDTGNTDHGYEYNVGKWTDDGYWHSDCLGLVHIAVNGFYGDKNLLGGGAVMDDFVLMSDEATTLNKYCSVKGAFPKADLKAGSLLKSSGHVGLYVGDHNYNGKIYNTAECTLDGAKGWIPTYTDLASGTRSLGKGGVSLRTKWTNWGEFDKLDYTEEKKGTFTDVTESMSSYKAIEWAAKKGYIKGYSDGTFRPKDNLTREQLCVILWRMAGRPEA